MLKFNKFHRQLLRFGLILALGSVLVTYIGRATWEQSCSKRSDGSRGSDQRQPGLELFTPDQLDLLEMYYTKMDLMNDQMSIDQLNRATLIAQIHSKPYVLAYTHRYEERNLRLAEWGGPESNQETCLNQLRQLTERVELQYKEKGLGDDINLYQLLDTYGWYSSGGLLGNDDWLGSYHECLRLKINSTEGLLATRYCSGAFKSHRWPKASQLDRILAHRAGVCLPKACDSVGYKNKFELIERLVKFISHKVDEDAYYLDYLYCLPDEQSALRLWYYSPKTVAFVGAVAIWIALVLAATVVHKHHSNSICKSLSVVENIKSLLRVDSKSLETPEKEQNLVQFEIVEGIKVIAMCYVITGHVLLVFSQIMNNGREMSQVSLANWIFLSANMTPSFAVNVFFSVTGILTSYLLFKESRSVARISNWIAFVAFRYIRIMPIYALVVAHEKYLAKYMGSGPLWDYGTSSLGARHRCERESWLWILLFGANLKAPLEHCIGSAWYLANDFQFFLVTPIFLALLHKRPKLGRLALIGTLMVSYLITVVRFATSTKDLRAVHQFRLDGMKTYTTFMPDTYTQPQYRIPAYLFGLLMGHKLHEQERASSTGRKIEWPSWMRRCCKFSGLSICSCILLPHIGKLLRNSKFYTNISFGFFIPSYNLLFGLGASLYILLASTGHGNRALNKFLASARWKPLSRLNLCVLLLNIQVISYFAQTSTHLLYFDFKTILALNLFSIVMSYSVAALVHLLIEAPLQKLIKNHLMPLLLTRGAQKTVD